MRRLLMVGAVAAVLGAQTRPAARPAKPAVKPAAGPAAEKVVLPEVTSFTLPNGLQVWLAPDAELPAISGRLVVAAGTRYDVKPGQAQMTADLVVVGGSGQRNPTASRRFLEERSAEFTTSVNAETASFSFWTLSEFAPEVMDYVATHVLAPSFDRTEFMLSKDGMRRAVSRRNEAPNAVAAREFLTAAFGEAYTQAATLASVEVMQREDLTAFHQQTYRPDRATLLISGDFTAAAMRALIERHFGAWQRPAAEAPAGRARKVATEAVVRSASIPALAASDFQIGYALENATPADHAALAVFATMVSDNAFAEVVKPTAPRATPTASSLGTLARTMEDPPTFRIVGTAPVRETVEAVRDTLAAFDQTLAGKPAAAAFTQARDKALRQFLRDFSRRSRVLNLYGVANKAWGDPAAFLPAVEAAMRTLTPEQMKDAVQRLLPANRRVISVAGETRDFRTEVGALRLPAVSVDMTIPPAPPEAPASPEQLTEGAARWRKLQAALKVGQKPVADAEIHLNGVAFTGKVEPVEQKIQWVAPASVRVEQTSGRTMVMYYDTASTWVYDGFRVAPFGAAGVRQYRGEVFRFPFWLAMNNPGDGFTVRYLGSGILRVTDGTDTVDIGLNDQTNLPDSVWYVDPGNGQRVEERMTGYREYDGVPYWGKLEMYRNGILVGELGTSLARFNVGLTAAQVAAKPDVK